MKWMLTLKFAILDVVKTRGRGFLICVCVTDCAFQCHLSLVENERKIGIGRLLNPGVLVRLMCFSTQRRF